MVNASWYFEDDRFCVAEHIEYIPKFSQRQDSLDSQLLDLFVVANRIGLREAAEFIKKLYTDKNV